MNSMVNTTLTSNSRELRCISSNALHSFQDLGDVVTAFKMHRSMKVSMNPAGDNIVASIPSAAAWSAVASMSTLYDQCPKVATAHNARRMVTVEIWVMNVLHMCAGLDRAQTKSSSVFRIKKDARLLITVTGPWRTRKDNASIMEVLLALWLECVLAQKKRRWTSVVRTRPNQTKIRPCGDRQITTSSRCIRCVEGHGRKKIMFPSGNESDERSAIVPVPNWLFPDLWQMWISKLQPDGRNQADGMDAYDIKTKSADGAHLKSLEEIALYGPVVVHKAVVPPPCNIL